MEIIPYTKQYFECCLAILDSNSPTFFDPTEQKEFIQWLHSDSRYWVVIEKGDVVACGGIYLAEDYPRPADVTDEVGFAWGMVDRTKHGLNYGSRLVRYRLDYLEKHYQDRPIIVRTTQKTAAFYEKFGFRIFKTEHHGYGHNLHKLTMVRNQQDY